MNYNEELDRLKEYMPMYIQMIPYFDNHNKYWMSNGSFEYFKKNYNNENYGFNNPHYCDSLNLINGELIESNSKGLNSKEHSDYYRLFNYWYGNKIYTGLNVTGKFTLNIKHDTSK